MSPELIYGQYGAIVLLIIAVQHLYRENTKLRDNAMELLKKYQERDEAERNLRLAEDREELQKLKKKVDSL